MKSVSIAPTDFKLGKGCETGPTVYLPYPRTAFSVFFMSPSIGQGLRSRLALIQLSTVMSVTKSPTFSWFQNGIRLVKIIVVFPLFLTNQMFMVYVLQVLITFFVFFLKFTLGS